MAIIGREEFLNRIKERIGESTEDKDIQFLEDMTDTYNDLEAKSNKDQEDWKSKYEQLDKDWRKKYKDRFFNSTSDEQPPVPQPSLDNEEDDTPKNFTDLFNEQK